MSTFDPKVVDALTGEILRAGPICDECLGRVAARLGTGLSNAERGRRMRAHVQMGHRATAPDTCWVCDGAFTEVDRWAERAVQRVADVEFATYLFGVKLTAKQEQMEAFYQERFPSPHRESFKHSLNRALGVAFERRLSHSATVDFSDPHTAFVVDLAARRLSVHIRSLYLYGRYRKLQRGIPQTKWPCRACGGRGCEACAFTGKQYPTSVEEQIGEPLQTLARAEGIRLHGAGREDIDARMLGDGRPFVLELLAPQRRAIDLNGADERIREHAAGAVEIGTLRFVNRRAVKWVKAIRARKRYRAQVGLDEPVTPDALMAAVASLVGDVAQRTPRRVAHRRADLVRHREVFAASGSLQSATAATVEVDGDGGLYIKELISGDDGRTQPNLAERLGVRARVTELDVLAVDAADLPHEMELASGLS